MIHLLFKHFANTHKPYMRSLLLFMVIASAIAKAQPGDAIDSLITTKKVFSKNEKIEFKVKLDKHLSKKPNDVRHVRTMSCACNNKDFCYEVYSIPDDRYPLNKKPFLIHSEKPEAEKCLCKVYFAEFYNKAMYNVPPLNKNGKYILIIRGTDFVMYSNIFSVID